MIRRVTSSDPCPICDGCQEAPQGEGIRCWGYLSEDNKTAFCTREEFAGSLDFNDKVQAFPHRLYGACLCGCQHGADQAKTSSMTISASYDYTDESGNLLFQSLRYQPKRFSQRSPDPRGGWVNNLKGIRRVIYQLPHLLESDPDHWVFVVEGEKDVDALLGLGMVATCNPMGAGKWIDEYSSYLMGR